MNSVLLVGADAKYLAALLRGSGRQVHAVDTPALAWVALADAPSALVMLLPDEYALRLAEEVNRRDPTLPIVAVSLGESSHLLDQAARVGTIARVVPKQWSGSLLDSVLGDLTSGETAKNTNTTAPLKVQRQ